MKIVGVLWHSVSFKEKPYLKYFVQPSITDKNYSNLLKAIGKNSTGNDWNNSFSSCVNAFIGKLDNDSVAVIQTLPWNYQSNGCQSGGTNGCDNGWIQFEICEDNLKDKKYFEQVYKEGCLLTAYLCKKFNINPYGFVEINGTKVPTILCHKDAYNLGMAGNHIDILHWFPKFGKDMNTIRKDVSLIMENIENKVENSIDNTSSTRILQVNNNSGCNIGDILILKSNARTIKGTYIFNKLSDGIAYVRDILANGNIKISAKEKGTIIGIITPEQIISVREPLVEEEFYIKLNVMALRVRDIPSFDGKELGVLMGNDEYIICETYNNWGKLKHGQGWICLDYVSKM